MRNEEHKHVSKVSRKLAKFLRHAPEEIGITLDAQGWVDVPVLLNALEAHGFGITPDQLDYIVATSNKKRFTLTDKGARIRAAQGHSVKVDLAILAKTPPAVLYHGTANRTVEKILQEGLRPMRRQQVHLSADHETAIKVGKRHGPPVVLIVDTGAMKAAGIKFYEADNGVWLTDHVAPAYLRVADQEGTKDKTDDT